MAGVGEVVHFLFRGYFIVDGIDGWRAARGIFAAGCALYGDFYVAGMGQWVEVSVGFIDLVGFFRVLLGISTNEAAAVRDCHAGLVAGWVDE